MKICLKRELKNDYSIDQAILDQANKFIILEFKLIFYTLENEIRQTYFYNTKHSKKVIQYYEIHLSKVKEFDFVYEIKISSLLVFFFKNRKIFVDSNFGDNNTIIKDFLNSKKFKQLSQLAIINCWKGKNYFKLK
jgi:hypothetical protein